MPSTFQHFALYSPVMPPTTTTAVMIPSNVSTPQPRHPFPKRMCRRNLAHMHSLVYTTNMRAGKGVCTPGEDVSLLTGLRRCSVGKCSRAPRIRRSAWQCPTSRSWERTPVFLLLLLLPRLVSAFPLRTCTAPIHYRFCCYSYLPTTCRV